MRVLGSRSFTFAFYSFNVRYFVHADTELFSDITLDNQAVIFATAFVYIAYLVNLTYR